MATQKAAAKDTAKQPKEEDPTTTAPKAGGMFGITTETKSKNQVPFQPSEENPITLGYLVDVKTDVRKLKKTEEEVPVLVFEFKDIEKVRTHYHIEWRVETDDKDFKVKMDGMNARIKHIYEEFQAFPVEGIGTNAESFEDFFAQVAEAFNTGGKDETPIYKDAKIWIKLSYNLKSAGKAQLGFPLSPNFIERYKDGKRTTLYINKKYETLKQPEGRSAAIGLPTEIIEGEFPDFPSK